MYLLLNKKNIRWFSSELAMLGVSWEDISFWSQAPMFSAPGLQVTEGKSDWSANHLELLMQFPSYPPQLGGQKMPAFSTSGSRMVPKWGRVEVEQSPPQKRWLEMGVEQGSPYKWETIHHL